MPEQRYIIYDCELEILSTIASVFLNRHKKDNDKEVKIVVENIRKRKIDQYTEEG